MKKYKVLVTGSSGLIGSELVKQLNKREDVYINGLDTKKDDYEHSRFKFFKSDITNIDSMSSTFKDIDIVIHLASIIGVSNTERNPLKTIKNIILGTKNCLELSRKFNVKKFSYGSSSEVYGESNSKSISESLPVSPKSVYASSKLSAEYLCQAYNVEHNLNFNIMRFFNVIGEKQKLDFVISNFIDNLIKNKNIEIYGGGNQIRAFCDVRDAVDGIIRVNSANWTNGNIYNIGNPRNQINIRGLAEKIKSFMPESKSKIVFKPFSQEYDKGNNRTEDREIYHRVPDIKKIKSGVNFDPKFSLDDTLEKIIEFRIGGS
jgi:UDP-glucose 4-epimerase